VLSGLLILVAFASGPPNTDLRAEGPCGVYFPCDEGAEQGG
jgi:hypothetical protein